jgi:hypothetical protein
MRSSTAMPHVPAHPRFMKPFGRSLVIVLAAVMAIGLAAPVALAQDFALQAWPSEISSGAVTVRVYEPVFDEFSGGRLSARAAAAVIAEEGAEPSFGAVRLNAAVSIDHQRDLVTIDRIEVADAIFPGLDDDDREDAEALIAAWGNAGGMNFSLDRVMDDVERHAGKDSLNVTPPRIMAVYEPAALIMIDGEPILRNVPDSPLMTVINTPYMIVLDPSEGRYYLSSGLAWYSSTEVLSGWEAEPAPPRRVRDLIALRRGTEQDKSPDVPENVRIIVATDPTELIVLTGEPQFVPLVGGTLLAVRNTESDLLFTPLERTFYVLISGRWFVASSLDGPWSFRSPDELPSDFARIPEDSDYGHLLVAVPGTAVADKAVLDATVPHTAAVSIKGPELSVDYDGEPQFEPAGATGVRYAANTSRQVLHAEDHYYAVHEGVWFEAGSAYGPWLVATRVPRSIYRIPAWSPVYNVTCVRIYDAWADFVYVGYTSCYTGTYVYAGTIVYGTGYYYAPWLTPHVYYPRPYSYGFYFGYNPWTAGWHSHYRFGGPFLGIGLAWGWTCNCATGGIYGSWWGTGYRPWPNHYHDHIAYSYGHGHGLAIDDKRIVVSPSVYAENFTRTTYDRRRTGRDRLDRDRPQVAQRDLYRQARERITDVGGRYPTERLAERRVFVDREGEIYRRDQQGTWQRRERNDWRRAARTPQLDTPQARIERLRTPRARPADQPLTVVPRARPTEQLRTTVPRLRPDQQQRQQQPSVLQRQPRTLQPEQQPTVRQRPTKDTAARATTVGPSAPAKDPAARATTVSPSAPDQEPSSPNNNRLSVSARGPSSPSNNRQSFSADRGPSSPSNSRPSFSASQGSNGPSNSRTSRSNCSRASTGNGDRALRSNFSRASRSNFNRASRSSGSAEGLASKDRRACRYRSSRLTRRAEFTASSTDGSGRQRRHAPAD